MLGFVADRLMALDVDQLCGAGAHERRAERVGSMTEAPQILLEHRLKSLKLPTVLREYGLLARQSAAERLERVQFLPA